MKDVHRQQHRVYSVEVHALNISNLSSQNVSDIKWILDAGDGYHSTSANNNRTFSEKKRYSINIICSSFLLLCNMNQVVSYGDKRYMA